MCKTSTSIKRPITGNFVSLYLLDSNAPATQPADARQSFNSPIEPSPPSVTSQASEVPAFPLNNLTTADTSTTNGEEKHAPSAVPACINCRRSKVRCEGGIPCRRCLRLGMDVSCARCEPQKRGRKRKQPAAEAAAAAVAGGDMFKLDDSFDQVKAPATKRSRVRGAAGATTNANGSLLKAPGSLVPQRMTADQLEQQAIDRFSTLTRQFRSWRDQALAKPDDKTGLTRFLMFCSDLSHMMHEYNAQLQHVADKNKLVSYWLCANLADDVNRVVTALGHAAILPKLNSDSSIATGVEKQVYKRMPLGVLMLPLQPRPFAGDSKAWVNPGLSELLGYSKDECHSILAQRAEFTRLLNNSTALLSSFWDAVAEQKTHFVARAQWIHKNGAVVTTMTTCWIKYVRGLPAWLCLALQQDPSAVQPAPVPVPVVVAAAAPVMHSMVLNTAPVVNKKAQQLLLSSNDMSMRKQAVNVHQVRPTLSNVFDDVMVLSPTGGLSSGDSTSSWDESCDKWLSHSSPSFDDIELML